MVAKSDHSTFIFIVVLAVGAAAYLFMTSSGSSPQRGGTAAGNIAPPIEAAGWVNGEPPADLSGKVVVVDAWATWCGPCKQEAPHLVETYQKFAGRDDLVFIGLTSEDESSLPGIKAFLNDVNITWHNGYGASKTLQAFGAEYIPSVWVINKQGEIIWNFDSREELADAISRALDE